jgi:hypothetical protein
MGLKQLKEQNKDFNINLIDIISSMDTTKTKKITPLLVKILKNQITKQNNLYSYELGRRQSVNNFANNLLGIQKSIGLWILDVYFGFDNVDTLPIFIDYLERGLVENNDISTYQSMDDIVVEIGKAATKEMLSKDRKSIMIVHDDDEWMFLKPLTYNASVTYGYGTKWCTSMKNEAEYFYRYSKQGVLIYVINKINGRKFGVHSNDEVRMGIYNETDVGIDSFETGIPQDLLTKLYGLLDVKTNQKNYELFSDEEKVKCENDDSFGRFMNEPDLIQPGDLIHPGMEEVMEEILPIPEHRIEIDNRIPVFPNLRLRREEVVNRWAPLLAPDLHEPTHEHRVEVTDLIRQQISDMLTIRGSAIDDLP